MAHNLRKAIPARSRLLTDCALAAVMFAVANAPSALAASTTVGAAFQGDIQSVPLGGATFQSRSGVLDTINISATQTVINWSTFDTAIGGGPITFLPGPATALFQNDPTSQITNFTVLNRILPTDATRAIKFDGTIRSQINGQTGGSVWFYTPGGIILGPTATFDVGNLVLSAADIDTSGNSLFGVNGTIRFRAATNSNAAIDINAGARILATVPGSYVAVVAPRITQAGTVNVNGSVGYIAAEQVDVRINQGLFDIEFLQGTGASATPIIHTGVTTGSAPDVNSAFQRIYLAAYPKNDAITLLVTGGLGYGAADAAYVDRGQVVLSAGDSIRDAGLSSGAGLGPSATSADIRIGAGANADLTATSSVTARASHDVIVSPSAGFKLDFRRDLNVFAGHVVEVGADDNETILVGQNLNLFSRNIGAGAQATLFANASPNSTSPKGTVDVAGTLFVSGGSLDATGTQPATAKVTVDGGRLNVGQFAVIDATDQTFFQRNTVGGNASVDVRNGGVFNAVNGLQIRADAISSGFQADDARAGSATLSVQDGTLTTSSLMVSAAARSGNGATATGGIASLSFKNAATLNLGNLTVGAEAAIGGEGGTSSRPSSGLLGDSAPSAPSTPGSVLLTGGNASLSVENTVLNIGTLSLSGSADGRFGNAGSDAVGGTAILDIISGRLTSQSISLVASAFAEQGSPANDGPPLTAATSGGKATGGTARLTVSGGVLETAEAMLVAVGTGGDGGGGSLTQASAAGGSSQGGTAEVVQTGGTFATQLLNVSVGARGGRGGTGASGLDGAIGGSGTGGTARLTLGSGGVFDYLDLDNDVRTVQVNLDSTGSGGSGGDQVGTANGGAGGSGIGGLTSVNISENFVPSTAASGRIISLVSEGFGGIGGNVVAFGTGGAEQNGGRGGAGSGGTAIVTLSRPNTNISSLSLLADGGGGNGGSRSGSFVPTGVGGLGGSGSGGNASVSINASATIGDLGIDASAIGGIGGNAATGGNGGNALGTGRGTLTVTNGITSITNASLTASSDGNFGGTGQSANSGTGGNAQGGIATILSTGTVGNPSTLGNLTIANLTISSNASGGDGATPSPSGSGNGGSGGNATGGTASVLARNGGQIKVTNTADISAFASGGSAAPGASSSTPGNGGVGGNATGGTSLIDNIGSFISVRNLSLDSDGDGGSGGAGGETGYGVRGVGGKSGNGTGGIALANNIDVSGTSASAFVSASGSGGQAGSGSIGGAGGTGKGGTSSLSLLGSATSLIQLSVSATGSGADGGQSSLGIGANGGNAFGGSATAIVGGTNNGLNISTVSVNSSATGGAGSSGGQAQSGGSGGDATAGDAYFAIAAGGFSSGSVSVVADGTGGIAAGGGNGTSTAGFENAGNGGRGGSGTGGSARFQIANAANVSTNSLLLRSNGLGAVGANGGNGLAGTGGNGGIGGDGTGGSVFLDLLGGATLTSGEGSTTYDLLATGIAGKGGSGGDGSSGFTGGIGANGGNAKGGRSNLIVEGNPSPVSLNLDIRAVAGAGGAAGANDTATLLAAGNGGNATGGFSEVQTNGGTTVIGALIVNNTTIGGDGGSASGYGSGGDGGSALGAATQILASGGGSLTLGNLILSSNATGGSGGNGTSAPFAPAPAANGSNGAAGNFGINGGNGGIGTAGANGVAGANGGSGGKGGNGTGGLINILADDATITTGNITANANGFGGFGGSGGNGSDGGRGGNGGSGGSGASNFNFSAPNNGGNGGNGGAAGNGGRGGNGGNGGEGGTGFGGTILLRAQHNTLATGNLTLTANGTGALAGVQGGGGSGGSAGLPGNGGARGESGYGAPGIPGQRGAFGTTGVSGDQGATPPLFQIGFGGRIRLESQGFETGSTLTAGVASLTASGLNSQLGLFGVGGDITIRNEKGTADQPDVVFEMLTAESNGFVFGSINFEAINANVLSNNNIVGFATGDTNVSAQGTGELRAVGNIVLRADGNFTATHSGRAADGATVRAENVNIVADNIFDAQAGSLILARDSLYVQSLTDRLSTANLTAAAFITAIAGADLTIGNATTTTPAQANTLPVFPGLITLQAGQRDGSYMPANLTVNGTVTSTGDTLISSGGDIIINGSALINSNNRIVLNSGDDIFINDGARLTSGLDPIPENGYGATGSLEIAAGSISVDAVFPDFVHSIIVGNANLTATKNILSLSGEAIQASNAQFQSGQFSALINNAPASNVVPSNDSGQLNADCVQGNICLGKITATFDSNFTNASGAINIGPANGTTGLPNSVSVFGSLDGKDISIRARDSIALGQPEASNVYQATNSLFVSALGGDVTIIGPALVRAGLQDIRIFAGGDILGSQANLDTLGQIGLYAGGDINLGSVSTSGYLQTIDSSGNRTNLFRLDVPGAVTIGHLQAVSSADIRSGSDILLGDVNGQVAITLTSVGNTTITGSATTSGDLNINAGNDSSIGNATAAGNIFVLAGGNAGFASASARMSVGVRAINLTATSLTAGEDITIRPSGIVNITSATVGDDFEIFGGSNVNIGSATALGTGPDGGELQFNTSSITRTSGSGDASNIDIEANGSLTVGNLTAADDIFLSGVTSVTATGLLKTTGTPFSSVAGDNDIEIFTGSAAVSVNAVDSASDFEVQGGSFTASGALNAKEDVELRITGATNAGAITAGDDILVNSSGAVTLGALVTNLNGPDDEADGHRIGITGPTLNLASATSAGRLNLTTSAGDLITGNLLAASGATLTSAAKVNAGDVTATLGNIRINAQTGITSGNLSAPRGSVFLNNLSGDILSALITVQDDFTLSNGGLITLGGVTAGDDITITAGSTASLGNLLTTGAGTDNEGNGSNIALSGPNLNYGTINARTNVSVSGGTAAGGAITSGAATAFGLTNTASVGAITAGTSVSGNADFGFGTTGPIQAGSFVNLTGQSVGVRDVNAGTTITLTSTANNVQGGNLNSGTGTNVTASGSLNLTSASATSGNVNLSANSSMFVDTVTASNGNVTLMNSPTAGSIVVNHGTASRDFTANASSVTLGGITAGDDIRVNATFVTIGQGIANLRTTGLGADSEGDGSNIVINGSGQIFFDSATLNAAGDVLLTSTALQGPSSQITAGRDIFLRGTGANNLVAGNLNAGRAASLNTNIGSISVGNIVSAGASSINSAATITAGSIVSTSSDITLNSQGAISTGNLTAALGSVSISNTLGTITTGLIGVGNDFTLNTGSDLNFAGVSVGDDIRITTSGNATLGTLTSRGTGVDSEGDGSNIVLNIGGRGIVTHADARNNFSARAARFETGLNSIITGGDIDITTSGDALLGNSTAGGHINVSAGGLINFNALNSVAFTNLAANNLLSGGSISSGDYISGQGINGTDVALAVAASSLYLGSNAGPLNLGTGTSGTLLQLVSSGLLTAGTLSSGGDIFANSSGNIAIQRATALGTALGGEGNLFIIATGAASLTDASAKADFGITGSSVNGSGAWSAGEDLLVITSGSATLGNLTSGDDITLNISGNLTTGSLTTTGLARDDRNLTLFTGEGTFFQINSDTPNGSNVSVTAGPSLTTGSISAKNAISLSSAGLINTSNISSTSSDIGLVAQGVITTGNLTAANGNVTLSSAGNAIQTGLITVHDDFTLNNMGLIMLAGVTAGDDINISGGGNVSAGTLLTTGLGTDRESDGSNIVISASGTLQYASARAARSVSLTGSTIAGGTVVAGAGDIALSAQGAINTGDLTALNGSVSIVNTLGTITTGLIGVGNDFTLNTGSDLVFAGVTVGDDIRITTSSSASLGTLLARGTGLDSESDGSNIVLNIGGSANVSHGEAVDDFTAVAARFETGLNSLITGGDISISASGDSLLGNSTAGGFISVSAGGLINFNALNSGGVTQLFASNTVIGGAATSGQALTVNGANGINIASVTSGGNVTANVSNGTLNVASATSVGSIRYSNSGSGAITANSATSGGNIEITSGGTVSAANLSASGGYNDPRLDGIAEGDVFVIAAGNATVGTAMAAAMLGIQGANIVSSGTLTAGEDILVTTGGTAMLANLSAGDNVDVIGVGGISLLSATTSGAGRDDRSLSFESGYGGNFFQINSAIADGGDINLTSSGAGITVANMTAADDIKISAATAANVTGLIKTRGFGTIGGSSDISVNAATASITSSDAFNNLTVTTTGNQALGTSRAGGQINGASSGGNIAITALTSGGSTMLTAAQAVTGGSATAGTNLTVNAGTSISAGDFTATSGTALLNAGSGNVSVNNVNAGGNAILRAANGSITGNMLTGGLDVIVNAGAGGISLGGGNAARDVLYATTNGGSIAATSSMAGDDILITSTGGVTLGTAKTTGLFVESGYGTTPDGSNLTVTATGPVSIGTGTATDNVTITGQSLDAGSLIAGMNVTAAITNLGKIGTARAGAAVMLTAGTLDVSAVDAGSLTSTSTNASKFGTIATTGNATATSNSGGLTTGNATAGGGLSLTSNGGGSIIAGNLSGVTGVTLTSGNLVNSGAIASTGGNISVAAVNAVSAGALSASGTGSSIAINSGGDVGLASATAANNISVSGVNLTAPLLSAGNDISTSLSGMATLGTVTGTGAFDGISLASINAARGVTIQRTDVKGGVTLSADSGAVRVTTDLKASGTVIATGRAIDLTSLGALTLGNAAASDGNITVTAGALSANQASARGDLRLTTTSGDLVAGVLTTGTGVGASAGGTPGPGDIILTSSGGATLNGTANAQRNLNVTSAGPLSVNGLATGAAIDLRSADITIGSTATVGQQGRTTSVTLTNSGNGVTTIGGNGVTTGYSLSNAEAQRIFGGDIIIVAPRLTASNSGQVSTALNSRAPDVILDTLTLTGANGQTSATAGNIGSNGRLRIQTAGKLRTIGSVSLTNLTSGNRFQIAADETIEVDAATGSIRLRGASTALAGTLELTSADVIAASLTNIAAVATASDTKAISDRLGLNDGAVNDDGYLSANSIVVNVANGFYVQNSGAVSPNLRNFRDRRGVTVGEGGLSIRTNTPSARIVINGRQVSATAVTGFATGIDFLKLVTFNGNTQGLTGVPSGLFDLNSTINGCAILNAASCQVNFDNGNITRDVINNLTEEERRAAEGDGALPFTLLSLKDVEGLPFQPVIDDPVTGSGNDDLWAIDDDKKCPDGEPCPK